MSSAQTVSRICRLLEIWGATGEGPSGAELAKEYAGAAEQVRRRLDAALAAADAGQIADAIKTISEEPPLVEEIGALDFPQLAEWESLCEINNWAAPPKIGEDAARRVAEIADTKEAIEPFLKMYKRAVHTGDARTAVRSLRRLADLDKMQDWNGNLRQSEKQLREQIAGEFAAARSGGETETCDALARELCAGAWLEAPTSREFPAVFEWRKRREEERIDAHGRENAALLAAMEETGSWKTAAAMKLVQECEDFIARGWRAPDDARAVVKRCRERCATETAAAAARKRWREVNESLHAAIESGDCAAIRDALAAPEFIDREPENGMRGKAEDVIAHEEAAKRRKVLQIAAMALCGTGAVLAVSAWWLREKMFAARCDEAAARLEAAAGLAKEKPSHAIKMMDAELKHLAKNDPDVRNNAKVAQFGSRLAAIVNDNAARTNSINEILLPLEKSRLAAWDGAEQNVVTTRISKAEALLAKDDDALRRRFAEVKNSWLAEEEKRAREERSRAEKSHAALVERADDAAKRLESELAGEELKKEAKECGLAFTQWKRDFGEKAPDLEATLATAEKTLNDAIEKQRTFKAAVERLANAKSARETIEARSALAENHSGFAEAKTLSPLPYDADEADRAAAYPQEDVEKFAKETGGGISEDEFKIFLDDSVRVLKDIPQWYSLYAVHVDESKDANKWLVAICKGKPEMTKPSYDTRHKITADAIFDFRGDRGVDEMFFSNPRTALMPSSVELRDIVDYASRKNVSIDDFEKEVLKKIQEHLKVCHETGFVKREKAAIGPGGRHRPRAGWYSPLRRVQMLSIYMKWLKDELKLMPDDRDVTKYCNAIEIAAKAPKVDRVDAAFAWLYLPDERVRKRTETCIELLAKIPADWPERYRAAKKRRREALEASRWHIVFAGRTKFAPADANKTAEPGDGFIAAGEVKATKALYVLRKRAEATYLVPAFRESGGNWRECREGVGDGAETGGCLPAEPLFCVMADGNCIDVAEELARIENATGCKEIVRKIPLFGECAKEKRRQGEDAKEN